MSDRMQNISRKVNKQISHRHGVLQRIGLMLIGCVMVYAVGMESVAEDKASEPNAEQVRFFESKIRPLFHEYCVKCHGDKKQKAELRLDSRVGAFKGGESGVAIKPGNVDQSLLIETIRYKGDIQMPPKKKLPDEKIALIEQWVKMGAPWKAEQQVNDAPSGKNEWDQRVEKFKREHWSVQPIQNPAPPTVKNTKWASNPIDQFILRKLEQKNIKPNEMADRATYIRRATFDLHGLPPTPEEVDQFVNDTSADAYAKLIDRLLASPRYGERWGRHWLDVARYADTRGYALAGVDPRLPYAYTYRDYVIRAHNEDKPVNQFIKEQIAADLIGLESNHPDLAALGFITVGRRFLNGHDTRDDRIDLIGRGLLGLTVACARCHDHKFDPITIKDYYSMYGIFASTHETNPDGYPVIGEASNPELLAGFNAELKKREQAIENYYKQHHATLPDKVRKNTEGYFLQVSKQWGNHQTADKNEKNSLRRRVVNRWAGYIAKQIKANDYVFTPLGELNKLKQEGFEQAAQALLKKLQADPESVKKYHPHVVGTLITVKPKTFQEAAKAYGRLLFEVHQEWVKAKKADPNLKALPDAHREALREVLHAADSPATFTFEEAKNEIDRAERNQLKNLQKKIYELHIDHAGAPPRAMVLNDNDKPYNPYVFKRGNPALRGDAVKRRFLSVLDQVSDQPFTKGSGRLELAEAIIAPNNPLTSRVFVNRVWMHHFGTPIVDTVDDFGLQGTQPSHPELLDHLASWFMKQGWSLKKLHRYIMLSSAYKQAGYDNASAREIDPENRLLWKFAPRRLSFEAIRDSMLAASGNLNLEMGGRSVRVFKDPNATRRSVYGYIDRQDLPEILRTFGFASPDATTPKRNKTTVPQQALFVMNNPFSIKQAEEMIERKELQKLSNPDDKIRKLYELLFAREASDEEVLWGKQYIEHEAKTEDEKVWEYGYGHFDVNKNQVLSFTPLPYFTGSSWQGGPNIPDPKLQWALLRGSSGHVGVDHQHAVIYRWHAPDTGSYTIKGMLEHKTHHGDGVQSWVVLNGKQVLGGGVAHNGKTRIDLKPVTMQAGDTLDFVTNCRTEHTHDSFFWQPVITSSDNKQWNPVEGLGHSVRLNPWAKYVHALMSTNEFIFID